MAWPIAKITGRKVCPSTTNHLCVVAWSGKGKDTVCEWLIGQKLKNHPGMKIIDMNSINRKEGWFYSIPNDDTGMIQRGKHLNKFIFRPQGFENDIYCILGKRIREYKKLPKNVKIVTLDKNSITGEDLIPFIADTPPAQNMCSMIQYYNRSKQLNLDDFLQILQKLMAKEDEMLTSRLSSNKTVIFPIIRNIINLKNSGIFSDAYPKLDINEVMKNTRTITTFSYDLIDGDRQTAIVKCIIAHTIKEWIISQDRKKPILIYYREFQDMFDKEQSKYYEMLRQSCWYFLTQGRDNKVQLLANFQAFSSIPAGFRSQFQQVLAGGNGTKETEQLLNWASVDPRTLDKMTSLRPGQFMFIHNGEYEYIIEVIPPLNKKKEEGFPVISYLCARYGSVDLSNLDFNELFNVASDFVDEALIDYFDRMFGGEDGASLASTRLNRAIAGDGSGVF